MRNRGVEIFLLPEVKPSVHAALRTSLHVVLTCVCVCCVELAQEWRVSSGQPFSAEFWRIGPLPSMPNLGALQKYTCTYVRT